MKGLFILLVLCITACGPRTITHSEVEVTYFNGEKDTVSIVGRYFLNDGCLHNPPKPLLRCGVRGIREVSRTVKTH